MPDRYMTVKPQRQAAIRLFREELLSFSETVPVTHAAAAKPSRNPKVGLSR